MNIKDDLKVRNVLRVGLYVRVSTTEQAEEGYSVGEQTDRLKKYCEAMGWSVYKIYVDPGYSGGNMDRPGLKEMNRDVENGLLDKVVVYKLDRLSRSQFDTLYLIEKVFLANNTDFVSMTENFNTTSPLGRAMIGFLAVFAQLEKDKINERMVMGKEARAKEGKWHGGSTQPVGYDYNQIDELLHVNEYEKMILLELSDLFLQGTPLRAIETLFIEKGYKTKHGYLDPKTMRRVLSSKLYLGYIHHKGEWYPGLHDPIYTEERFEKQVALLKARREAYEETGVKAGAKKSYLGGLLFCKCCGAKYTRTVGRKWKNNEPPVYYVCYSRSKKVKKMIKDPNCKNKNWKMEELDGIILGEIKKLAMDQDYLNEIRKEKEAKVETLDKIQLLKNEIKKLDDQISRFMDLYGIGKFTIDQVSAKVDPLNDERNKLERELEDIKIQNGTLTEEQVNNLIESFEEAINLGDFDDVRALIESLIIKIELDGDDVDIYWNFD